MVCFSYHKEGHKSYMCRRKIIEDEKKRRGEAKNKVEATSNANSSNRPTLENDQAMTYKVTKGGKWGKAKAT